MLAEYSQSQLEFASVSLESRNLPDTHYLNFVNGKLVSPATGLPVEYYMTRRTAIDEQDWIAFQKTQNWVSENNFGVSFWLSAPHPQRSPQAKLYISELQSFNGEKRILNRAILFDTTEENCIWVANNLRKIFSDDNLEYQTVEQLRADAITHNKFWSTDEWVRKVELLIAHAQNQWDMIANGEDFKEVKRTLEWTKHDPNGVPMGNNPTSCPPGSPSQVFGRHALEGRFVENCGKCGVEIKKVIFKGYVCPKCEGVYEGC